MEYVQVSEGIVKGSQGVADAAPKSGAAISEGLKKGAEQVKTSESVCMRNLFCWEWV